MASTLCCITRSMPAMPMAESSPPMVVGIRQTSSETSTVTVGAAPAPAAFTLYSGERLQRHHGQQEDQRQPGDHDVQRDLVRRLLPLRAFHQRDHAIEKRLARIRRDLDLDPVGEHLGAAGHGAAVAARFADHRRALAGDGRFVHAGDALDHFAVAGNHVARLRRSRCRRARSCVAGTISSRPSRSRRAMVSVLVLRRVSACALPRPSAMASAKLANSTVNQSQSVICAAKPTLRSVRNRGPDGGHHRADLHHEHDRVLHHAARIQLAERIHDGALHDGRVEQRRARVAFCEIKDVRSPP